MNLQQKADDIRREVIEVACKHKQGHIASSLSCVDILVALYYDVMGPNDKLIFSKAHGCYALYAILADKGVMPKSKWLDFDLPGCAEYMPEYGIEAGCGSLGHGLPMAVGMAYAYKLQKKPGRIFCIAGDGEMQEGTNWEALQFFYHREHELDNLTIIIDHNLLQAMEPVKDICSCSILDKLEYYITDGHDMKKLVFDLRWASIPLVVAVTHKGYGFPSMQDNPVFHYRLPSPEEYAEWKSTVKP